MTDWKSPCVLCGYNGSGFYQPETHACMKHGSEREALLAEVASLQEESASWRRAFESLRAHIEQDAKAARDAGLTFENLRTLLADYERGDVSFSRVADVMRTTAHTLAAVEVESIKTEVRTLKQRLDCTYGDTPGLFHCPIDKPCAMHEAEQLRENREKRLKAQGFDDTRAPNSVGALIGLQTVIESHHPNCASHAGHACTCTYAPTIPSMGVKP